MRGRRDELRDLADAFDSMVARVEGDVERQRRFVANASHELRTPLAVSGASIEVAQADPDPDVAALLTGLGNANARATDLTQALLLMALLEAKPPETGPVDLSIDPRPAGRAGRALQRGVGRTRDGHNGSGLGLAIASSIVESLSGTLTLAARPEGGLMVEAWFPLAKDARGPGHAPGTRLR